jgi:tetratricopeptide (TPR) repeat protein
MTQMIAHSSLFASISITIFFALLARSDGAGLQLPEGGAGAQVLADDVQQDLEDAERAWTTEDYERAAFLYARVTEKVPDLLAPKWQYGLCLILSGQIDKGTSVVDECFEKEPSLDGLFSTVVALEQAGSAGDNIRKYRKQALRLARSMEDQTDTDPFPLIVLARLSLDEDDDQQFRRVTHLLIERFPDEMETHYYNAIRAARDSDWIMAEDELRQAGRLGLPEAEVERILSMGIHSRAVVWRYFYYTLYVVACWLVGLAILFVVGKVLSALTLRWLGASDATQEIPLGQRVLRKVYRVIINLGGLYYYLSLPVVVFLSLALPASAIYGMLMLPVVDIRLLGFVVILGIFSIFACLSGIRTCFVRIPDEEADRPLGTDEAPALWAMTRDVARKVGTRPIDEIWITPGPEIAVFERGSYRQRMIGRGRRTLILGLAALNGFRQDAFRTVIAHEYGHFLHRDTAGGEVAMRVNTAMSKYAEAVVAQGSADWWNVGFHFLRVYHFLFRRISFGASRLQEVLADSVAIRAYGPDSFEQGLTHVVRRSVEFSHLFSKTVCDAVQTEAQPIDFYKQPPRPLSDERAKIELEIADALTRPSSEDDTHPSPIERFAFGQRSRVQESATSEGFVWDLLPNRKELTREMNDKVTEMIAEQANDLTSEIDQFIDAYDEVIAGIPTCAAYEQRGAAYFRRGDCEAAITDLSDALRLAPEDPSALIGRGFIYRDTGEYDAAIRDFEKAIQESEGSASVDTLYALGECYSENGQQESAIQAFSKLLADHDVSMAALLERGNVYFEMGQHEQAIRDYTHVIEQSPSCSDAYCERGLAKKAMGDYQNALADYNKSVELEPEFTDARLRLAWLLSTCPDKRIRDGKRAVELAKDSCELSGWNQADEIDVLAAAHAEAGNFDRACHSAVLALRQCSKEDREACQSRLSLYRQRKPFREEKGVS